MYRGCPRGYRGNAYQRLRRCRRYGMHSWRGCICNRKEKQGGHSESQAGCRCKSAGAEGDLVGLQEELMVSAPSSTYFPSVSFNKLWCHVRRCVLRVEKENGKDGRLAHRVLQVVVRRIRIRAAPRVSHVDQVSFLNVKHNNSKF